MNELKVSCTASVFEPAINQRIVKEYKNADQIDASESEYLYIGPSVLPNSGNGLLTAIDIYKDEIISYYRGEFLSEAQAGKRALNMKDQYFINMADGRIMDSIRTECFAKYANDATGFANSGVRNNSKIALDEFDNVCLIATRNIRSGEEIFCSYGKRYWKKHGARD